MRLKFTIFTNIAFLMSVFSLNAFSQNQVNINLNDNTKSTILINDIREINFTTDIVSVKSFEINDNSMELNVQDSLMIGFSLMPADATNRNIEWISTNESVAIVSESGMVYGLKMGEVTITGITESGNLQDQVAVKVIEPTSVGISREEIKIYPNPTRDRISIEVPSRYAFELVISDLKGNVIYSEYDAREVSLMRYASGTFFVTIIINNSYFNYKIIKN